MSNSVSASAVKELRGITDAPMMDCKKALVEADGDMDKAIQILREKLAIKADKRSVRVAAEGVVALAVSSDFARGVILELNCETDFVSRDQNFLTFSSTLLARAEETFTCDEHALMQLSVEEGGATDFATAKQELMSKTGENVQLRRVAGIEGKCVNGYLHGGRIGVLVELDQQNPALAKELAMHIAAAHPQAIKAEDLDPSVLEKEREIYQNQARESGKPEAIIAKMVEGRITKFTKEICLLEQPFVKDPDQTIAGLLASHNAQILSFIRYELGEGIEVETVDFASEVQAQLKGE